MIDIKYIVVSDIHLGHLNTPTVSIIQRLDRLFYTNVIFKELDIIFIAGDAMDRLLDFTTDDIYEIEKWIARLLLFCAKNDIALRVLEGTPSHDWRQPQLFETVNEMLGKPADLVYHSALGIEYMSKFGINVLYVPDEWDASTDKTFDEVKQHLKDNNLNQVDISIMHGQFGYQIPNAPDTVPKHNEENYLGITKHYIHIGHVHTHSQHSRIIAQGSFDRLAHGEESDKGLIYVSISKDIPTYEFIINKDAEIYKTIDVDKINDLDVLDHLVTSYRLGSNIRLTGMSDHPYTSTMYNELKLRYIQYNLKRKVKKEKVTDIVKTDEIDEICPTFSFYNINQDNIKKLVIDNLLQKKENQGLIVNDSHIRYIESVL